MTLKSACAPSTFSHPLTSCKLQIGVLSRFTPRLIRTECDAIVKWLVELQIWGNTLLWSNSLFKRGQFTVCVLTESCLNSIKWQYIATYAGNSKGNHDPQYGMQSAVLEGRKPCSGRTWAWVGMSVTHTCEPELLRRGFHHPPPHTHTEVLFFQTFCKMSSLCSGFVHVSICKKRETN